MRPGLAEGSSRRLGLAALGLVALLLAGCASPPPPAPGAPLPPPPPGFDPILHVATDKGDFYVEVFQEQVPRTAKAMLDYARSHFFDGMKVHRVIGPGKSPPDGLLMQFGDPNTRDPTKSRDTWGLGDPAQPKLMDEFTPALRFAGPGMVALSTQKDIPNSGTSQIFVTTRPATYMDDLEPAFGKVIQGMDVVKAIVASRADDQDRPVDDIGIQRVDVIEPQRAPGSERVSLDAWTYQGTWNTTANRTVQLSAVVHNGGNVRAAVDASVDAPAGWTWEGVFPGQAAPFDTREVPANGSMTFLLRVTPPAGQPLGDTTVTLRFASGNAGAALPVTIHTGGLGAVADTGRLVAVHYIGSIVDGRLFDTDQIAVATGPFPKYGVDLQRPAFQLRAPADYRPLNFTLGSGDVIPGFDAGALGLREGESRAVYIPPDQGYKSSGAILSGRYLVFVIELVQVVG